jgi:hypothetical protein
MSRTGAHGPIGCAPDAVSIAMLVDPIIVETRGELTAAQREGLLDPPSSAQRIALGQIDPREAFAG